MTQQDQPDSNTLESAEVKASGELKDGIVTVTAELDGTTFEVKYPNDEGGYSGVDTLYAAWPTIMGTVLEQIAAAQEVQGA